MHTTWKIAFLNPLGDTVPTTLFFGKDVTNILLPISAFLAESSYKIVELLSSTPTQLNQCTIQFANAQGLLVVWGCSGIKQMLIFTAIILISRGDRGHKIWFIPAGILLLHLVNISRLVILAFVARDIPSWFDFVHGVALKVGYYVLIFGLWLIWLKFFTNDKQTL